MKTSDAWATSKPLRENARLLGKILGDVICDHEGDDFFQIVEETRVLSKRARFGDQEAQKRLEKKLSGLTPVEQEKVAKAFTEFLRLANLAEQTHRVRRRRAYEADEKDDAEHTLRGMLRQLKKRGLSGDEVRRTIEQMKIDLVLTAHPTEAMSLESIMRYRRIHSSLRALDDRDITERERRREYARLKTEILSLWLSGVVSSKKPTPTEEARDGLNWVETTLWEASASFYRALDDALHSVYDEKMNPSLPPVRFGSWMGGDRDGNPFVTHEVTREVLESSLRQGITTILRELEAVRIDLTIPESIQEPKLQAEVNQYLEAAEQACEPSRSGRWPSRDEVLLPLETLRKKLNKRGLEPLARGRLSEAIWKISTFGVILLPLDIRQSSDVHETAVSQIVGGEKYRSGKEADRCRLLWSWIERPTKAKRSRKPGPEGREVMATLALIEEFPPEYFGAYIVSMAETPSDLLEPVALMRLLGIQKPLPVVPLFETPEALENAVGTLEALWSDPRYRKLIAGRQQIMLGYSDSAKRSGRLSASWAIHQAQRRVLEVAARHKVEVIFFHGRGGSIDRGGGPIRTALQALPRPHTSRSLRVTEQGEAIFVKFGLPEVAERTLELYVAGFLEAILLPPEEVKREWEECMDRLAVDSAREFRNVVYDDPSFPEFLATVTPVDELSLLRIGSRPARRTKGGGLDSLRAIPWVFAWTQVRLLLPAWLGVGHALAAERERGGTELLREMYRRWPFFQATLGLIEMTLAKAEAEVFRGYLNRLTTDSRALKTGEYLIESLGIAAEEVLDVTEHHRLLENRPLLARSIRIRNPYVDILNFMQMEMLASYRRARTQAARLERALMTTVSGISAGMRNTG